MDLNVGFYKFVWKLNIIFIICFVIFTFYQ